jgi:hypothetical protein
MSVERNNFIVGSTDTNPELRNILKLQNAVFLAQLLLVDATGEPVSD